MTLPVPNETPFESGAEQGPVGSNHQEDIAPENQKRLESMIKESREKLSEILTSGVSKQVQRLLDLRNEKWVELIRKAREEEDKRKKSRQPEPLIDLQHIGEPEFKEKMIAISASKEQFDYRSRTFFRREILEGLSMENAIRQFARLGHSGLVDAINLFPFEVDPSESPESVLKRLWEKDQETLKSFEELKPVHDAFQKLKEELLGRAVLEDRRNLDTDGEKAYQKLTWGKFMERIITLVLAEYLKGTRWRVIPVDAVMDYYGLVDLMVEIKKTKGKKHIYKYMAIDVKTRPYESGDDRPRTKRLKLTEESAKEIFPEEYFRQYPERYTGPTDFKRALFRHLTEHSFKEDLLSGLFTGLREYDPHQDHDQFFTNIFQKTLRDHGILTAFADILDELVNKLKRESR